MSSITRAIQALDLLARKGPLGVRAVAQQLTLPLGSVHRLLLDLAEENVVERTPDGSWALSFRLFEITGHQLDRVQLPRLWRPFAERIAHDTGETVNLNALSGMSGMCIDKVRGNEAMQMDWRIGAHGPLYCGGSSKAILAWLGEEDQERVLAGPMLALTPRTIIDPAVLRDELVRTRERGYAIDDQEVVMGVYCVAVPILDRNDRPVGAISITGPKFKQAGADVLPMVEMLNEVCGHISRRLGYAGAWPLGAEAPRSGEPSPPSPLRGGAGGGGREDDASVTNSRVRA